MKTSLCFVLVIVGGMMYTTSCRKETAIDPKINPLALRDSLPADSLPGDSIPHDSTQFPQDTTHFPHDSTHFPNDSLPHYPNYTIHFPHYPHDSITYPPYYPPHDSIPGDSTL